MCQAGDLDLDRYAAPLPELFLPREKQKRWAKSECFLSSTLCSFEGIFRIVCWTLAFLKLFIFKFIIVFDSQWPFLNWWMAFKGTKKWKEFFNDFYKQPTILHPNSYKISQWSRRTLKNRRRKHIPINVWLIKIKSQIFHFSQLTVEMNDLSHSGVIKTSVYLLWISK